MENWRNVQYMLLIGTKGLILIVRMNTLFPMGRRGRRIKKTAEKK
jgi:hypothetical protein